MNPISLKPFFTYFGGKYRLAPKYPKPIYDTIIEPFAGSAGYSVRYYWKNVILTEIDPIISGIWRYLISASHNDIMSLPLIKSHESVNDFDIPLEARHLIGMWLNKGTVQPCKTPSSWMRGGTRPNSYWGPTIRKRIATQVSHIKHWVTMNSHYSIISPSTQATWFIDPPYSASAGRNYKFNRVDFHTLANYCLQTRGQTIVCENMDNSNWLPFKFFQVTKANPSISGGLTSREAIYYQIYPEGNSSAYLGDHEVIL